MGKEVWELTKEEEGSTANERVRGRDCTPLSPWGCDHMWPVVTLPSSCHPTWAGHHSPLMSSMCFQLHQSGWGSMGINLGTLHFTKASPSALGENEWLIHCPPASS